MLRSIAQRSISALVGESSSVFHAPKFGSAGSEEEEELSLVVSDSVVSVGRRGVSAASIRRFCRMGLGSQLVDNTHSAFLPNASGPSEGRGSLLRRHCSRS